MGEQLDRANLFLFVLSGNLLRFQAFQRLGDTIDTDVFRQLLDLDERSDTDGHVEGKGDDHTFSREILWQYYDQARKTFDEMEVAL
jgi:hypothetical protein